MLQNAKNYEINYLWSRNKATVFVSHSTNLEGSQTARFMGPTRGLRWTPYWPHESCYQGYDVSPFPPVHSSICTSVLISQLHFNFTWAVNMSWISQQALNLSVPEMSHLGYWWIVLNKHGQFSPKYIKRIQFAWNTLWRGSTKQVWFEMQIQWHSWVVVINNLIEI